MTMIIIIPFIATPTRNQFNLMAIEVRHETIREMILSFNNQLLVSLSAWPGLAWPGLTRTNCVCGVKMVSRLGCD